MSTKMHLKLVTPTNQNQTVRPSRVPNSDLRQREYLLPGEIEKLIAATKHSRYQHRDATLILVTYRLRQLRREQEPKSPFVFTSERGSPFTPDALNRLVKRVAQNTNLPFSLHIHMLRHSCGYKLANDGHDTRAIQDWLGHRAIQHTVRYTEGSASRFKDF
jgi:site-specific recombinase XerC